MTYRELTMIDVREVLRRWSAGQSNRQIARETGTDRDTVGRYINAAKEAGLVPAESHTPSDELVHQVARRVQARSLPERSRSSAPVSSSTSIALSGKKRSVMCLAASVAAASTASSSYVTEWCSS